MLGRYSDSTLFESPLTQSRVTDVGLFSVEEFDVVQSLPEQPLIKGKHTGMFLKFVNSSPIPRNAEWEVTAGNGAQRWVGKTTEPVQPFEEVETLLPIDGESYILLERGNWEFTLFGSDPEVEDYAGRSKVVEAPAKETFPLDIVFMALEFPSSLGIEPISKEVASSIQENHSATINAAFPMPHVDVPPVETLRFPLTQAKLDEGPDAVWSHIVYSSSIAAIVTGIDRVVTLFPDDARIWPEIESVIGWASASFDLKYCPTVLGTMDVAANFPETSAHEMLHTFGFDHTEEGAPLIPIGFDIGPDGGRDAL